MIDKELERGHDMYGLVAYLLGKGRHNEHVDPHVVAGDAAMMDAPAGWVDLLRPQPVQDIQREQVVALGRRLDEPRRLHGTEVKGGHVWHATYSISPSDGVLSDGQWAQVAQAVARELGFTSASGHAACPWVAIRHGQSLAGNDHIHIVANLVREDGTRVSLWQSYLKMGRVAAAMERRLGLSVVEGRRKGAGLPSVTRAEMEIAARADRESAGEGGRPGRVATARANTARARLARTVRAAATAAGDEAEFLRRLRHAGVLARPRYAPGGRREVVGFSVAMRPRRGEEPRWFGGGSLAPDLTLPRLRAMWGDSPQGRSAALPAWAGKDGQPAGREARVYSKRAWDEAAQVAARLVGELASVPVEDEPAWAEVASRAAGVFAALSGRFEPHYPGPLARAADTLAYSAQRRRSAPPARSRAARDLRGVAMVALQAGPLGKTAIGDLLLLRQMTRVMQHVHDAHVAVGEAAQAARLATVARGELAALHQRLGAAEPSRDATTRPPTRPPQQRSGPEPGR